MSEKFEISFDGVKLSATDKDTIQHALQKATLTELARLDVFKSQPKLRIDLPDETIGMVIRGELGQ